MILNLGCMAGSMARALVALPSHQLAYAHLKQCWVMHVQRQRRRIEAAAAPAAQLQPPLSADEISQRRIVVTGMGVVSSLSHDVREFYSHLLEVCCSSPEPNESASFAHTEFTLVWFMFRFMWTPT